jgi:hypothetical protein
MIASWEEMKLPLCAAGVRKSSNPAPVTPTLQRPGWASGRETKSRSALPRLSTAETETLYTVTGCGAFFFTGTGVSQ